MNEKKGVVVVMLLMAIGAWLRIAHLGNASMWVDEVNSAFAAESLLEKGQDLLPSGHGYGRAQLFTALVAGSFRLFGKGEVAARMPAALFGILAIGLAAAAAWRWYGQRVALMTAFLMTFSHFEVGWSRVSRMYTLLQVFTLLGGYFLIEAFEAAPTGKRSFWSRLMGRLGIDPVRFLVGGTLLVISWKWVHELTILLIPGIAVYLLVRIALAWIDHHLPPWKNPHGLLFGLGLVGFLGGLLVPSVRSAIQTALTYTPPWAAGDPAATHPMVLFEFLISPWRFPLAAFFFIGVVQHLGLKETRGWMPVTVFGTVFLLLSFLFTHRTPTYLFFVYPFFLMVSAYGLIHWAETESDRMVNRFAPSRIGRWIVLAFLAALFVVSPWLRITLNIPRLPDGITNLAVTPEEWREASQIVRSQKKEGDVVLASLPQVAAYYGVRPDYGLNWANLNQAIEKRLFDAEGEPVDIYVGVRCVRSLAHLESIVGRSHRGWIMVSTYHLTHPNYIPDDVRQFLEGRFRKPRITAQGTVRIYAWGLGE